MTEAHTDPTTDADASEAPEEATAEPAQATPPKAEAPGDHYREIRSSVLSVQRLILGRLRWEGAVHAGAVTAASLLLGALLFAVVPAQGWMRALFVLTWLGATGAVVWWRTIAPSRRFARVQDVGQWVEEALPEFRNDITASLQFGRDFDTIRDNGQMSVALIARLLSATRAQVKERSRDILAAAPRAQVQVAGLVIAGALAGFAVGGLVAPDALSRGLSGLAFGASAPKEATTDQVIERSAIVADLTLSYNFPAYSGLPPRRLLNTTGDIEVLRGTEVTFEATAIRPVRRAELLLKTDAAPSEEGESSEPQRFLLERRPGGRLVARFNALDSGTYTITATLEDGTEVEDGIQRSLVVLPDENPRMTVFQPDSEIDVAPGDVVTFVFEASDDFGLTELAIVTALNGADDDKQRALIKTLDGSAQAAVPGDSRPTTDEQGDSTRSIKVEHLLDLVPYNLRAKDQLVVWLEAIDNDTVSGPKVATSEPILLRVASPEDKHLQIIAEQEEIVEALILNLADFLEAPIDTALTNARGDRSRGLSPDWGPEELGERFKKAIPPHTASGEIVATMNALLERMEQDPLMLKRDLDLFKMTHDDLSERFDAEEALIKRLTPAARDVRLSAPQLQRLAAARKDTVRSTEQGILRLDDLIASQRMENALETAKDLQEAKERLRELLEKYKETRDDALKAEIMREMMRLRQRMMELMAKMKDQLKDLPKEHINMEALEKEGLMKQAGDINDSFSKIEEMLEKGDIEGALKALDEMGQNIDDMVAGMEEEFSGMQPEGLSELDKQASEIMDEINDLQAQEEKIAEETDELAKEIEESQREMLEEAINEFSEQQLKRLDEVEKRLDGIDAPRLHPQDQSDLDHARENAERLREALEQRDIAQALDEARNLEGQLQRSENNMKMRNSYTPKNDPRRPSYQNAKDGVQRARPRSSEITEALERMMEKAQDGGATPDQKARMNKLGQRQGEVRQRLGQLQKKISDMQGELPMLQEQLAPGMGEAGQFMEGAQQRLNQGQGRKAHGNEQMALDKLGDLKQSLKQTLKKEKMGQQGRDVSREPVAIPEEDRSAPREFREDLMEAMKENSLENYKPELQLYYESLVR